MWTIRTFIEIIQSKNVTKKRFLNRIVVLVGKQESDFAPCLATVEKNIMHRNVDCFLVLHVQNLNGLHDDFHTGARPPIATVRTVTSTVVSHFDTDGTCRTRYSYPQSAFAFLAAQSMLHGVLYGNLYQHGGEHDLFGMHIGSQTDFGIESIAQQTPLTFTARALPIPCSFFFPQAKYVVQPANPIQLASSVFSQNNVHRPA